MLHVVSTAEDKLWWVGGGGGGEGRHLEALVSSRSWRLVGPGTNWLLQKLLSYLDSTHHRRGGPQLLKIQNFDSEMKEKKGPNMRRGVTERDQEKNESKIKERKKYTQKTELSVRTG